MTVPADIDGRFAQGWGGVQPNGVHVNVILAHRGTPTAAAMVNAFTSPGDGYTPILVCTGVDQPSYETVNPPTIMVNKTAPASAFAETLTFGAAQVGVARGVLDAVADGVLAADQNTVVFVSLWLDPVADAEDAVCVSARHAVRAALGEAVAGRDPLAVRRMVDQRDILTHPYYGGG
jgi:formaldehyde-activating enzyme